MVPWSLRDHVVQFPPSSMRKQTGLVRVTGCPRDAHVFAAASLLCSPTWKFRNEEIQINLRTQTCLLVVLLSLFPPAVTFRLLVVP